MEQADGREIKRIVPNIGEQRLVREVNDMHRRGINLSVIAATLNKDGVTARNGKAFDATQIKRMISGYENKWKKSRGTTGETIRRFISAIG